MVAPSVLLRSVATVLDSPLPVDHRVCFEIISSSISKADCELPDIGYDDDEAHHIDSQSSPNNGEIKSSDYEIPQVTSKSVSNEWEWSRVIGHVAQV